MKKTKIAINVLLTLCVILVLTAVMIIRNVPRNGSLKFAIFSNIEEMSALEEHSISNEIPKIDRRLNGFTIKESWERVICVENAKCTVRAYVFETREDASSYYKKVSNRTKINEGANGSASAGFLFGVAEYVTFNNENVLVIKGKNIADINKVLDVFIEANPNALIPFSKE